MVNPQPDPDAAARFRSRLRDDARHRTGESDEATRAGDGVRRQRHADSTPGAEPPEQPRPVEPTYGYLRKQRAPHVTMGLLALAASASRAAGHLTGAESETALATAGAAFVVAVVFSATVYKRLPTRKEKAWAIAIAGAAATWLSVVAANGMSWDAAGLLVALGTALSLFWWRSHRIPNGPDATPIEADEEAGYAALWAAHCGGNSHGPMKGTWLTSREAIKAGERYVLQLVPGRQSLQNALAALPVLRSGLRLRPGQDLIIERHPVLDESCLSLTIVTRSPVNKPIAWPGPSTYNPRTGTLALGPFVDGEGIARWKVCTDNSLWGGFLCGGIGSGKSRMFEALAMALAAHGFVVWFADKQKGASSPLLAKYADDAARDVPAIDRMLDRALLVMMLREAENTLYELDGFTHSEQRPGLFIFIDESHAPFADPRIQAKALTVAREGRKLGVAIIAASQAGTIDAFGLGPSADTLRGALIAGNLVVLRCNSNNPKNIFGLDFDPKKFPVLPGYAYLVDTSEDGTGRSAPLRGFDPGDKEIRQGWAERITWRGLDEGAGNAAGLDYRNRRDRAQADMAALAQRVAMLRAGIIPPTAPTPATAPSAATAAAAPMTAAAAAVAQMVGPRVSNIIKFPTWEESAAKAAAKAAGDEQPQTGGHPKDARLTRSHLTVLNTVRAGRDTNARIREVTNWGETHVRNLLNNLVDWEYLRRDPDKPYGTFSLTRQADTVTAGPAATDNELHPVIELVVRNQLATRAHLCEQMQVTEAQAEQLLTRLEQLGIVGAGDTDGVRDVLVAATDLDQALARTNNTSLVA